MANRRMIPTSFFRDPDILMLNKDEQLILIGLVLAADDYGRELAHAHLLGNQMGYTPEQMESALQTLVANDLLVLYEGGRHRYFSLTRWWKWQTIPEKRRIPSNHPAPPTEKQHDVCDEHVQEQHSVGNEQAYCLHNADNEQAHPMHTTGSMSVQENQSESKRSKEKGEEEKPLPPNVVTFPTAHITSNSTISFSQATYQIATILKLPMDDALERIVEDYCYDSTLSLFGEADAAREWIDDIRRNSKQQRMTPAFFRRWLKREHEDVLKRQATGTTGTPLHTASHSQETERGTSPDDPYAAFLAQRTREVTEARTREPGGTPL